MNISIIIFCHNEAGNIKGVIESTLAFLRDASQSFEIIVVDDGSTDETAEIVSPYLAKSGGISYLKHPQNSGIGMALRTGYSAARMEYVCAVPGDGQFDVAELKQVKPFNNFCFYSFYRPHGNYNLYRSVLTYANRQFNRLALGLRLKDVNWIKVYRKEQLSFVEIELKSSIIESEICAKLARAGASPIEIPSVYHNRRTGLSSGGSWKTLRKVILEMYRLFYVVHKFKKHF